MDSEDKKAAFEAMKAKANAAFEEKRTKREQIRKFIYMRFDTKRENAATDHALRQLESPRQVKQLTSTKDRPAEKLVKRKTKGMKRSPGRSM